MEKEIEVEIIVENIKGSSDIEIFFKNLEEKEGIKKGDILKGIINKENKFIIKSPKTNNFLEFQYGINCKFSPEYDCKMIHPNSKVGKKLGFDDNFTKSSYLTFFLNSYTVWLSFIHSNNEGKGNFLRLLNNLKLNNFRIIVPSPSNRMQEICIKFGFPPQIEIIEGCECLILDCRKNGKDGR